MTVPLRRRESRGSARVLLLHGLGCTNSMWDRFADQLGDSVELWDVRLPWHGLDGGWGHVADQAAAVVDAVENGPGFDAVIAHSFAAGLLLEAFAADRIAPRPAVLASVFYRAEPTDFTWTDISRYLNEFHLIFAEALRLGGGGAGERLERACRIRDQIGPYGWVRFFESYLRTPFLDLSGIRAPQLVLAGDSDIATRQSDSRALAELLPSGGFGVLGDCGHFPMLEQPGAFARAVLDFLTASVLPTSPALELT
ncbi:alpha/beta fold hydrolase [Amycolatopsis sp. NPDC003676]